MRLYAKTKDPNRWEIIFRENLTSPEVIVWAGPKVLVKRLMKNLPLGTSVPEKVIWILDQKNPMRAEQARKYFFPQD